MEDDDNPFVEELETCRAGHGYVILLWVSDGSASYSHEDSMAYCPECGEPSDALSEDTPGVTGDELLEVRSFYELIDINLENEPESKQRYVHLDVIDERRERA